MKKNTHYTDFNLVGVISLLFKKSRFIIILTVIAMCLAFAICKSRTRMYTSKTSFIVKNPSILDRGYVFNIGGADKNYFAVPDDVDQVKSIAESDEIYLAVVHELNLSKIYPSKDDGQLIDIVKGNMDFTMKDNKNVELSYTDTNPKRAAQIANAIRIHLEDAFMNYFISSNKEIIKVLQQNTDSLQRKIVMLDDSIQTIRSRFSDNHQQLPVRGLSINAAAQSSGNSDPHLLERLNEVALLKDKLATQATDYQYLLEQYYTITDRQLHLFYVIQNAYPKRQPSSPKTVIIVAASAIATLFFACVLVIFNAGFQKVTSRKSFREQRVMASV